MAREVVLGWQGKDGAWEQHFHVQAAFCQLCPGINEGDPLAGSFPVAGAQLPLSWLPCLIPLCSCSRTIYSLESGTLGATLPDQGKNMAL